MSEADLRIGLPGLDGGVQARCRQGTPRRRHGLFVRLRTLTSGTFFATSPAMRAAALLICLLCVTGCDEKSPVGPTVPLNERFTLAPGEVADIDDVDLRVQFVRVTGDSRCPADAVCIQGGDALVQVLASDGQRLDAPGSAYR